MFPHFTGVRWLAVAVAVAAAASWTMAVPGAHAASRGTVVTRVASSGRETISVSRDGYAQIQRDARGKLRGGYLIDYRRRSVTLLDPMRHRFERLSLAAAVRRVRTEHAALRRARLPYVDEVRLGAARAAERLSPTRLWARIGGLAARAWIDKRGSAGVSRVWYATGLPAPPPPARRLLATIAVRGGSSLSGRVALRIQQQVGSRFKTVVKTRKVVATRLSKTAFTKPPRGLRRARFASRAATGRVSSVPATVTNHPILTLPDIEQNQAVFAVYWGRRFASEPRTVRRLNDALNRVILKRPFVDGMAQYGVRPGRFLGSATVTTDPPFGVGNTNAAGWGAASAMTLSSRLLGAPDRWWRVVGQDPLIVLFVPMEGVAGGGNLGYHSVTPVETAPVDPLGIALVPVLPFAVVKVPPMTPTDQYIDDATVTLSHETAEAATDPLTFGWRQDNPPGNEQGEVSDICKEGAVAPFAEKGRVAGVAIGTYWSNADRGCVPDPRPSIRITSPGPTVRWGLAVPLSALASSPFDGRLGGPFEWTLDGAPIVPDAGGRIPSPPAGRHVLSATVTDSQSLTAVATLPINVVAEPPEVSIASPASGARIPLDATATLRGSAHDARGMLGDDRLAWSVQRAGSPTAMAAGRGSLVAFRFPAEGTWTVTLTGTSPSGASATRSVLVTVAPPVGDPSVTITEPADGAMFGEGYQNPIRFRARATTANGDPIAEGAITWSDDIDGPIGTGSTITHTLSGSDTFMRLHHVTVTATAPNGHIATQTIRVWSGTVG